MLGGAIEVLAALFFTKALSDVTHSDPTWPWWVACGLWVVDRHILLSGVRALQSRVADLEIFNDRHFRDLAESSDDEDE